MNILFVFLLGLLSSVASYELENAGQDGVSFEKGSPPIITADENNNGVVVNLVKVTGVVGTITASPITGQDVLELEVEVGDNDTEVYVTLKTLDFETLRYESKPFSFLVNILENNANTQMISVAIKNIDDESPVFLATICTLKEETAINITNSECSYQVNDPDGFLGNMDFSGITGSEGESDLFEFQFKEIPDDDVYISEVYLVLKEGKTLDYETLTFYNFRENAIDSAKHPTAPLASVPIIVEVEDIPDQRPQWISFHASVSIADETQSTEIQILATDGDYGINNPIIYGVVDESGYVHIDGKTGLITVDPIPKDAGFDQLQFYAIAMEEGDPNSNVVGEINLLLLY